MASRLKELLPTPESVLEAPLVDLAGCLLEQLRVQLVQRQDTTCCRNLIMGIGREYGDHGAAHEGVAQACAEAWDWLYINGFIGQHADRDAGWFTLTRNGREAAKPGAFAQWVADQELPESMLQADLKGNALPLYRQGRFDTAVFEAFKTLEVAIRDAAGFGHDLVGVPLVSRAFSVEDGPLTDTATEKGERVALLNLMAGAIGSYKNPHSHRRVEITAAEAREMLLLASHLLRIVAARRKSA